MTIVPRPDALRRTVALTAALAMLSVPAAAAAVSSAGGAAAPEAGTTVTGAKARTAIPTIATATTSPAGAATVPPANTGSAASDANPLTRTASTTGIAAAKRSSGGGELSSGAILAAVLGVLIALACLVWAGFRWFAVEPRWTLPVRHSIAEAGFRASAMWAEFTDWIRLGH